ncbi:MAG: thioredoxin domain-containing protein [Pseudomonadota bacterium]
MKSALMGSLAALAFLALPAGAQTQADSLANPLSAFANPGERNNWHNQIERTERGHKIGNPDSETELIVLTSYTCEECGVFAREGGGAIDLALLAPGRMSLEVRPMILNTVDLTIALLAQCGDAKGFKNRHRLYLLGQDRWLPELRSAPLSQQNYWARGDRQARLSMATALDLDDMLAGRGASRTDINRCLNDEMTARAMLSMSQADREEYGLENLSMIERPHFVLNGELLQGVHDWEGLYAVLVGRFRPETER